MEVWSNLSGKLSANLVVCAIGADQRVSVFDADAFDAVQIITAGENAHPPAKPKKSAHNRATTDGKRKRTGSCFGPNLQSCGQVQEAR
jgi:hypothetical protein